MDEEPSSRVVAQRIRNRIMETAELFADGPEGVRAMGYPGAWIEWFYDWLLELEDIDRLPTLSEAERATLRAFWHAVEQCAVETMPMDSTDAMIATGWPDRIAPVAKAALLTMTRRGVFSEEVEEDEPSGRWPR